MPLAAVNWMLGAVLAGGAVILIAPIAGLNPSATSLLIVPALAAALVGGFRSFGLTMAAGLAIGMVQSEVLNLRTQWDWLPDIGLQMGIPFVLIIVTMVVRGETLPTRATLHHGRFPRAPRPEASGGLRSRSSPGSPSWLCSCSTRRGGRGSSSRPSPRSSPCRSWLLTGYVGQISLDADGVRRHQRVRHDQALDVGTPRVSDGADLRFAARRRRRRPRGHPSGTRARDEPGHRDARRRGCGRGARAQVGLVHRRARRYASAHDRDSSGSTSGYKRRATPSLDRRSASSVSSCRPSLRL